MPASPLIRATRIVLALARPRPLPSRHVELDLEGGAGGVVVYDPPRGEPDAAVVIVPGLAIESHNDQRLHNLAMGFARGGLRGIVLEVPDMADLRIRPETEHDVAARLVALDAAGLVPGHRLGMLGPSFSGSLALRAAALPIAAPLVRSVITVGAYAEAAQTVDFLFHADEADAYGRMLLMLNFLRVVEDVSDPFLDALRVAIVDTGRPPDQAELGAALATLSKHDRERLTALLEDPAAWRAVGDSMLERGADIFHAMSVSPIVDRLRCDVFVMHGEHDNIVPASESIALHESLTSAGLSSQLVVTPLLDHANIQYGLTIVGDAVKMVRGFAHFVRGLHREETS